MTRDEEIKYWGTLIVENMEKLAAMDEPHGFYWHVHEDTVDLGAHMNWRGLHFKEFPNLRHWHKVI